MEKQQTYQEWTAAMSQEGKNKSTLKLRTAQGLNILWGILFFAAAGVIFLKYEPDYLFRIQELNLFLNSSLFFKGLMVYPAGFLSYLGTYLTQLFYYPALGAGILMALWALLIGVAQWAFKLKARHAVWLFLLPTLLLCTVLFMNYWIFIMKLKGYFFVTTLGMLAALTGVALLQRLPKNGWIRATGVAVWTLVTYPLMGYFSLMSAIYFGVLTCVDAPLTKGNKALVAATAAAIALVAPLLWFQYYEMTTLRDMYFAGFPSFYSDDFLVPAMRVPFMLLAATPLLLIARKMIPDSAKKLHFYAEQLAAVIIMALLIHHYWYRDDNFHKELQMNKALTEQNWQEVVNVARSETQTPTRLMVLYKNLALFRMGRAGNEMFHYLDGGKKPVSEFNIHMMQVGGRQLYYHYGKENFCYRWCIEDAVEYGMHVENLCYLTKICLLNNEPKLAQKYINLLKQTTFYKDWAEKYQAYINQPQLIEKDQEMEPIRHMMTYKDQLDGDNTLVEMYLLNAFANGDGDDPLYQEQTLISALLEKSIPHFWPRLSKYADIQTRLSPDFKMPIHYQEAAMLYGNLEHTVDISGMPFDESVKQSYQAFMAATQQCRGMTEAQMAEAMYPQFGNTFYYFYFFIRDVKSY